MIRDIFASALGVSLLFCSSAWAADLELNPAKRWAPPSDSSLRQDVASWASHQNLDVETTAKLEELWQVEEGKEIDLAAQMWKTLLLLAPEMAEKIDRVQTQSAYAGPLQPEDTDLGIPPSLLNQARFLYGSRLAEQGLYDEALPELTAMNPSLTLDPAAMLFFKAVCQHHLLEKEECLTNLKRLLDRPEGLPRRYLVVSQLMLSDIEPLEVDSLDEVARLMRDIERRLDLGRAGKKVRQTEEDVVAKLDKMIEELEEQQQQMQQQQQQQQGGQGNSSPSSPLENGQGGDVSGPGEVDPRKLKDGGDWGNLPPKERQEALQQISNEFPSHYRRVIEEYFRKLAQEGDSN
ncbi:MAG: hypothetical protein WD045_03590 [Pirellulaceae bacterium]